MSTSANGRACGTCRHFLRTTTVINKPGECRESAPTVIGFPSGNGIHLQAVHPPVQAKHWCGKWARSIEIEQPARGAA